MIGGLVSLLALMTGVGLFASVIAFSGDYTWFLNRAGLTITLGGLAMTSIVVFPVGQLFEAVRVYLGVVTSGEPPIAGLYQNIVGISRQVRREGHGAISATEGGSEAERFLAAGLELLKHGVEPGLIREVLVGRANAYQSRMRRVESVYQHPGMVSPMFGLVGTVIGLILMLNNVSNAEEVPRNMAVALVTTFYGISLAALVFNPIAGRIRGHANGQRRVYEMVLVGVLALQAGDPTRVVEEKLGPYLD